MLINKGPIILKSEEYMGQAETEFDNWSLW